jgi:hypothetical protein
MIAAKTVASATAATSTDHLAGSWQARNGDGHLNTGLRIQYHPCTIGPSISYAKQIRHIRHPIALLAVYVA